MHTKKVMLLGASGSIGSATLDILRSHPDLYTLVAASAHSSEEALKAVVREFGPKAATLSGPVRNVDLSESFPSLRFYRGREGLFKMIEEVDADIVVNGIAGAAGLEPSWHAIRSGKDLALANKETIVTSGPLIRHEARKLQRKILPVDSEHSAIFHLLEHQEPEFVEELVITASGGPFLHRPLESFSSIRPEEALKHPTWNMGGKITIDSATMANKGLEFIEAHYLFDVDPDHIKVVIHPQSMVHSLIQTTDGSLFAQISRLDMRIPIQNALSYPQLISCPFGRLELAGTSFSFHEPQEKRYPLLFIAIDAIKAGGAYPIAYNAADELAVQAFVEHQIGYCTISEVVRQLLEKDWSSSPVSLEEVLETDQRARTIAGEILKDFGGR